MAKICVTYFMDDPSSEQASLEFQVTLLKYLQGVSSCVALADNNSSTKVTR